MKVVVVGDWIPRSLFGSFHLLLAAIKAIYLALYMFCFVKDQCDLIIADQITFHLPLLKYCSRNGVLFYCHFPDKLLAPKGKSSFFNFIYRSILDWAEEKCLKVGARCVLVNSKFTLNKFKETFKTIRLQPEIFYPGVHIDNNTADDTSEFNILLSLNRFERKKDLHLAIEAFNLAKKPDIKLIMAGGYDQRVIENREHLKELQDLCDELGLKHLTLFKNDYTNSTISSYLSDCQVLFLPSINQETKSSLLYKSRCLLYTPSNEHFGIVPIEAMASGLPVIAMNSGGPKETVTEDSGLLSEPNCEDLAKCIEMVLNTGKGDFKGKIRVKNHFSLKIFGDRLDQIVQSMEDSKTKKCN